MTLGIKKIKPIRKPLRGEITVPGDKSISHRAIIFASVASGPSRISNLSGGEDNLRTLKAFGGLGVKIAREGDSLTVEGRGWEGLHAPSEVIDCGNSGTTMRLLAGILAGRPFAATLDGDESLRRRPMRRIMEPLGRMGAEVLSLDGKGTAPLRIRGGALKAIHYVSPVASAQVKSAVILAGLQATGTTVVEEPQKSRDHTEIMAGGFGAKVRVDGCTVSVEGPQRLSGRRIDIPGDLSAAAFFLVAGAVIPGSDILIRNVGLNPTRTGVIDVLRRMGAEVECRNPREAGGEPVGDLRVVGGRLRGVDIGADMVARTIDEYPILSVAAALAEGVTRIFGAGELRTKESDRIAVMVRELRKLGVSAQEREDGMDIEGCGRLRAARVDPEGDHRVAMAFAIAGLVANGGIEIEDSRSADISFPGFFERLEALL